MRFPRLGLIDMWPKIHSSFALHPVPVSFNKLKILFKIIRMSNSLSQVQIQPIYWSNRYNRKKMPAILKNLIFAHGIEQKCLWDLSCDTHHYDLVICLKSNYLFVKSPSVLIGFHSLIACLKNNVDFSPVSMKSCRSRNKKALYFETYTTFQLYELSSIKKEVILYQN